jgi:hypothetical protein
MPLSAKTADRPGCWKSRMVSPLIEEDHSAMVVGGKAAKLYFR